MSLIDPMIQHYLLKIQLLDIKPAIWRRFVVPADIPLDRLHDIIQIIMGWEDYHLYEFTFGKKVYAETSTPDSVILPCGEYTLDELIQVNKRKFRYTYDLGDCWEHEITLENNDYGVQGFEQGIFCFAGERACPEEDVGGVSGYYEHCIDVPGFDSERFEVEDVNTQLARYLRWCRPRLREWEYGDV